MRMVKVKENYLDLMEPFGEVDTTVEKAVKRYVMEKGCTKIEKCKNRINEFKNRYNCNLEVFKKRLANEESLQKIEESNLGWEEDLFEWKYYEAELKDWIGRIEDLLRS